MTEIVRPFRWNISRREQLGSLPQTELPELPPRFHDDLIAASARVIAFAGDSDLIFVGRSPDALFHFLSGALFETAWADRMKPLSVALRRQWIAAEAERAIRPYLDELGLSPAKLLRRIRPAAFVDVVDTGGTFGDLVSIMHAWTEERAPSGGRWRGRSGWSGSRGVRRRARRRGAGSNMRIGPICFRAGRSRTSRAAELHDIPRCGPAEDHGVVSACGLVERGCGSAAKA